MPFGWSAWWRIAPECDERYCCAGVKTAVVLRGGKGAQQPRHCVRHSSGLKDARFPKAPCSWLFRLIGRSVQRMLKPDRSIT
jgi:hypothetical protein